MEAHRTQIGGKKSEAIRTIEKHDEIFSQHRCIFDMHPGWAKSILETTKESKLNYQTDLEASIAF